MIPGEDFACVYLVRRQRTEPFEGAPKSRVYLQSLPIVLDRFLVLGLQLSDVTEEVKPGSPVWNFL